MIISKVSRFCFAITLLSVGAWIQLAAGAWADEEATWKPWLDLANLQPDTQKLINLRTARGHDEKVFEIQRIENGEGSAVNLDRYSVLIEALPPGVDKAKFFQDVRVNLNSLFDQNVAKFRPFADGDAGDWSKNSAQLGTIMVFEIKAAGVKDNGAVVVSKTREYSWVFSPVKDGSSLSLLSDFATHPVAGNREFGLIDVGEGKYEFYTRAVDRVYPTHVGLAEGKAFAGADKLWRSMQYNLVAKIIENGGRASTVDPVVPGGNIPSDKPQYTEFCKDPKVTICK